MSDQVNYCFYHPSRQTNSTCFRCNRNICDDDKMLYDDNTFDYGTIRDACIPCFAVLTEKDAESIFSTVVAYFFLLVWAILTTIIFWPLLVLSVGIFYFIYNSRRQKVKLNLDSKNKLKSFLETLDPDQRSAFKSIYTITCAKCGSMLETSDIYCRTCGDSLDF